MREWRLANPKSAKEYQKKIAKNMSLVYVAGLMRLPTKVICQYPELIEAKRAQLMILRAIKKPKCTTN